MDVHFEDADDVAVVLLLVDLQGAFADDLVGVVADGLALGGVDDDLVLDLGGLVEPETGKLRAQYDYEDIVAQGLYFNVPGYPHVDFLVDREHEANRFDGRVINGHRFEKIYMTTVRNLGIRKPGEFYYTLYRITPVEAP